MRNTVTKVKNYSVLIAVAAWSLIPMGLPAPVLAASHNVATCAALNTLGADSSTSADTITLAADLDCTGVTFTSMYPGGFTGSFDGQGHSISHLTISQPSTDNVGLFASVTNVTIQNLTLASGSVTGQGSVGGLIGTGQEVTIKNVVSNVNVTATGQRVGGIAGSLNGFSPGITLIEDVGFTGSISDIGSGFMSPAGNTGGLVGNLTVAGNDDATFRRTYSSGSINVSGGSRTGGLIGVVSITGSNTTAILKIEDSYTSGTVHSANNEVGGVVGTAIINGSQPTSTLNMTRVYSSATVTGTYGVGGLFGVGNLQHGGADFMTITDSFAVGTLTGTGDLGGLVGANSADPGTIITVTGSYYDGPGTGQTVCAALVTPTGTCTRIDTATQPNYFKGNHTSAPLSTWDFGTVWATHPGGYPTLIPLDDGDNIAKATELAAPNAGDANNNGVTDAAEAGVASLANPVSGRYATLETSCGRLYNVQVGGESGGQPDVAYNYPAGLVAFVAIGCTPGATATFTQYYYGLGDPATLTLRKWNSSSNAYMSITGAVFSTVTIGGETAVKVVYQVVDGGPLDQDGAADGNIVDPVGPAVLVLGAPNTGLGGHKR
jgi:hypothetical protein